MTWTVVAIKPDECGCQLTFDTPESCFRAASFINDDKFCRAYRFKILSTSGTVADSSLKADDAESMLRHQELRDAGFRCQMLLDFLDEGAAILERDRYFAWRRFVESEPGKNAIVQTLAAHESGHSPGAQLGPDDVAHDLAEDVPLDQHPVRGEMYRNWARSPLFVVAGKKWLASLLPKS